MSEQLLVIPKCNITNTALVIYEGVTKDEWEAIGRTLRQVEGAVHFWIGDWLRFGVGDGYIERDRYDEAEAITGLSRATLWQDSYVAEKVPPKVRRGDLGFAHHKDVAALPAAEQTKWLERAANEGMSSKQLRDAIKGKYTLPYPEREPFGSFYVIATVPDLHSHRIKLGFTEDTDRRLRELRTVASTAKLIHSWPCRRSWELSIITLLTAQDCVQLGREVFQCGDVGALVTRGNQLFSILP